MYKLCLKLCTDVTIIKWHYIYQWLLNIVIIEAYQTQHTVILITIASTYILYV